jgi:hypothetical protein
MMRRAMNRGSSPPRSCARGSAARVDVATAHRLDERADHVVVLVAVAVVAQQRAIDGAATIAMRLAPCTARLVAPLGIASSAARRARPPPSAVERPARVARGEPDDRGAALGLELDGSVEPARSVTARSTSMPRSSSVRSSSVSSSDRDSSGEITENDGFSVVAATRMTHPFSTPGSSASCCAL